MTNHLPRIDAVWMFVSVDEGGEGIVAGFFPNGMFSPYIAADEARLKSLIPMAKEAAELGGRKIRLIKFTTREELDVYDSSQ